MTTQTVKRLSARAQRRRRRHHRSGDERPAPRMIPERDEFPWRAGEAVYGQPEPVREGREGAATYEVYGKCPR
jgi:hypothetical protein